MRAALDHLCSTITVSPLSDGDHSVPSRDGDVEVEGVGARPEVTAGNTQQLWAFQMHTQIIGAQPGLGCLNLLVEGLPEVFVTYMCFEAVQRLLVALRNLLD